jgi:hypothetical protein
MNKRDVAQTQPVSLFGMSSNLTSTKKEKQNGEEAPGNTVKKSPQILRKSPLGLFLEKSHFLSNIGKPKAWHTCTTAEGKYYR